MSDAVIRVEGLGKQYRLGGARRRSTTLRERIQQTITAPFSRARSDAGAQSEQTFWALRDVNFRVDRGEVVGIIGRNGAGKSTLLKILSRITDPTEGQIEITGHVGSLLEVGTGFHPELTGRENVFLNGAILGMKQSAIARQFDQIVAFAEIEKFLDTPVKHYSSGMYMRLAFAVAAHLEPEILIVDEVLAVGDAAFQKKCLGKMSEVARGGRTVLFVSHNMPAISNLCTRAIVFSAGQISHDGPVEVGVAGYMSALRQSTSLDLRQRTDREGKGRIRFTGVSYEDNEGRAVHGGVSGQPLRIVLSYESSEQRPFERVRASVMITDGFGQILFNCSSELTNTQPLQCPPVGQLRCMIPRLPLSGAEYFLSPFIEVNGEVQDFVSSAAVLRVEDGDFYGSGRLYPPGWQGKGVLVPHQWLPCNA